MAGIILANVFMILFLSVRALVRRKIDPRILYGMWLLVAIRLMLLGSISLPVSIPVPEGMSFPKMSLISEQKAVLIPDYLKALESDWTDRREVQKEEKIAQKVNETVTSDPAGLAEQYRKEQIDVQQIIKIIWAVGMGLFLLFTIGKNMFFYGRLRRSRRVFREEKGSPIVYVVPWIESPFLYGFLRPAIYLDRDSYKEKELAYILAHETMHEKHKDQIWSVVRLLCLSIHWYNPIVWLASSLEQRDCECACDTAVVKGFVLQEKKEYGRFLLELGAKKTDKSCNLMIATSMSSGGKELKMRLEAIMRDSKKRILAGSLIVILAGILWSGTMFGNGMKQTDLTGVYVFASDDGGTDQRINIGADRKITIVRKGNYSFGRDAEEMLVLKLGDSTNEEDLYPDDMIQSYIFESGTDALAEGELFEGTYYYSPEQKYIEWNFHKDGTYEEVTDLQDYRTEGNKLILTNRTTGEIDDSIRFEYEDGNLKLMNKEGAVVWDLVRIE